MSVYFDSSAIVKLVVTEPESAALRAALPTLPRPVVSSALAAVEVVRATRRIGIDVARARTVLAAFWLLAVDHRVIESAMRADPAELRSLDAIHIASALVLGERLEGIVTYDRRMAEGATRAGIAVLAPR